MYNIHSVSTPVMGYYILCLPLIPFTVAFLKIVAMQDKRTQAHLDTHTHTQKHTHTHANTHTHTHTHLQKIFK